MMRNQEYGAKPLGSAKVCEAQCYNPTGCNNPLCAIHLLFRLLPKSCHMENDWEGSG